MSVLGLLPADAGTGTGTGTGTASSSVEVSAALLAQLQALSMASTHPAPASEPQQSSLDTYYSSGWPATATEPSPPLQQLPQGWIQLVDPEGRRFYQSYLTGECQYQPPANLPDLAHYLTPNGIGSEPSLPPVAEYMHGQPCSGRRMAPRSFVNCWLFPREEGASNSVVTMGSEIVLPRCQVAMFWIKSRTGLQAEAHPIAQSLQAVTSQTTFSSDKAGSRRAVGKQEVPCDRSALRNCCAECQDRERGKEPGVTPAAVRGGN